MKPYALSEIWTRQMYRNIELQIVMDIAFLSRNEQMKYTRRHTDLNLLSL